MKKYENYLITGLDGGTFFSVAVLVNLLLSLVLSLILQFSGAAADKAFLESYGYTYLNFLVSPVAILATLFYARQKCKLNLVRSVSSSSTGLKFYGIAALLFVGSMAGLSGLNTLFVEWLNKLVGYTPKSLNIPGSGFGNFLLCTLIICIIPAFFEELLFRGVVLNGAKRLGDVFAALVTGGLFCLYHHSPQQTIYQFILGVLFGLLAIKSGSIIPSMLFHFLNNFYIIVGYYIWGEELALPTVASVIIIIVGLIVLALGLVLLIKSKKPEVEENIKNDFLKIADKHEERKAFLISSAVGAAACIVLWIAELVAYIS